MYPASVEEAAAATDEELRIQLYAPEATRNLGEAGLTTEDAERERKEAERELEKAEDEFEKARYIFKNAEYIFEEAERQFRMDVERINARRPASPKHNPEILALLDESDALAGASQLLKDGKCTHLDGKKGSHANEVAGQEPEPGEDKKRKSRKSRPSKRRKVVE